MKVPLGTDEVDDLVGGQRFIIDVDEGLTTFIGGVKPAEKVHRAVSGEMDFWAHIVCC